MDKIKPKSDEDDDLKANIQVMMRRLEMAGSESRLSKLTLYCKDTHDNSDKKDEDTYQRIHKLDEPLCKLWKKILNPGFVLSRVYTPVEVPKPKGWCTMM